MLTPRRAAVLAAELDLYVHEIPICLPCLSFVVFPLMPFYALKFNASPTTVGFIIASFFIAGIWKRSMPTCCASNSQRLETAMPNSIDYLLSV